jgi:glycosyltransferase involved in cell wall biosynthesis
LAKLDTFVSVAAAFHNDAAIVDYFIQDASRLLDDRYTHYEILLIDDGSTDNTVAKITARLNQMPNLRLIRLSREFGTDIALTAGLESAIGDYVVTLIPRTDPIALVPKLIDECRQGKDMLFGVRANAKEKGPLHWATLLFYKLAENVFRLPIVRHATYFQVYSRQALNAVVRIKDKSRYLRLISAILGATNRTFVYVPIISAEYTQERGWIDSFTLALGLLTAHSANPLRVVSLAGLFASLLNLLYAFYILGVYVLKPHVAEGWTTLSLQTAGLFFWVLLILTVLSEYIGRILGELKDRPLYFTLEEKNSSVLPDSERRNIATSSPE